ncbi:hypothetical protein QPX56_03715 [Corynebacterium pseudodiphtheriticum]|uniref:ComF family protein n=1 Tax=Corynebacterium pseudodiphtheriticum TaxID=37637 RepID=UPI002543044C|nr:hypothetical protein [Corynebacterium pseudodiphtheriticum]MDK4327886.1 hypothetical protein [Corynebacterium pseudodiphtheriticum]
MDKLYNLIDSQKEYLHPATPHPNYSCIVCRGTKRDDFAECLKCGRDFRDAQWPDLLGFGVFARADEQSGTLMHRYKKSAPARASRIVGSLAAAAMHQAYNQLPTLDVTTTVPSTRGRERHPLHDLVLRAADYLPEPIQVKQLLQTNLETNPPTREVNSDLFTAIGNVEAQHILLIDDTWTTGAHMLSAVGALRNAGAARITAIALARWISRDDNYGQSDIMNYARQNSPRFADYDFFAEQPRTSLF